MKKEVKSRKLRHQEGKKYVRQKYLEEVRIKTAGKMKEAKLEMWDSHRNRAMLRTTHQITDLCFKRAKTRKLVPIPQSF